MSSRLAIRSLHRAHGPGYFPAVTRAPFAVLTPIILACGGSAQQPAPAPAPEASAQQRAAQTPVAPMPTATLAGQTVAVIPITLVAADPALQSDSLYAAYHDRRATLLWADSLIGDALVGRAPEVTWVLPPKLRKQARAAPGLVGDPDQMGQAVMRNPALRVIPDPLRSNLRSLVSLTNARIVMIPAALGFTFDSLRTVRADLSLALADARSGKVLWRSQAVGSGATPGAALETALAAVLPAAAGQ